MNMVSVFTENSLHDFRDNLAFPCLSYLRRTGQNACSFLLPAITGTVHIVHGFLFHCGFWKADLSCKVIAEQGKEE